MEACPRRDNREPVGPGHEVVPSEEIREMRSEPPQSPGPLGLYRVQW